MVLETRDKQILLHILRYCKEVRMALDEFDWDKEKFLENPVFRNACSMPIMQIGELAKRLSDDFIHKSVEIPWRNIKGMRDFYAHGYGMMDKGIIWETASKHIGILEEQVTEILKGTQGRDGAS